MTSLQLGQRQVLEDTMDCPSPQMRALAATTVRVALTSLPIVITGPTGVGKSLVARDIHRNSANPEAAFVKVNCAAIPESLVESELFGYEKGAFTGATSRRAGKFQQANGGTLFLDEISDMPLPVQAKILVALDEGEVSALGSSASGQKVNVRIVAATNRPIEKLLQSGTFREDLFYRLQGFRLEVPPLAERRMDILPLAEHFLRCFGKDALSPDVAKLLSGLDWPGNVRQLRSVMMAAAALSEKGKLQMAGFEAALRFQGCRPAFGGSGIFDPKTEGTFDQKMDVYARFLIVEALAKTGWVQRRAADLLGISRTTLLDRIRRLGIKPPVKES